jgi:hypothetical protein
MPILWAFLHDPETHAGGEFQPPTRLVFDHPLEELDILGHGAIRGA